MRLSVDVGQTAEGAQRPEVLPDITDGAFHLALFPSRPDMTGAWNESILAGKAEKAGMESNQVPIVFSDDCGHVVEPEFPHDPAHRLKSVDMTADESLKRLAVGEFHIHLPAVTFDQTEGIELARC